MLLTHTSGIADRQKLQDEHKELIKLISIFITEFMLKLAIKNKGAIPNKAFCQKQNKLV